MPTLLGEKREGSSSLRLNSNGTLVVEDHFNYLVRADHVGQSRIEIETTSGLPVVGLTLSSGGLAVCSSKSAERRTANPLYWDVKVDFSSEVQESSSERNPTVSEPTSWIPVYETKFERLTELVTADKDGTRIANSAGVPYDTGLQVSRFIPVWHLYQFEPAGVTDEAVIARNEVVNESTWKTLAAKTVLCTVESSVIGNYYGRRLRLTYYSLKYNKLNWRHKRLDIGTSYKSGSDLLPYTDKEGNIILGALNGSGAKQAVGTPPAINSFDVYPTSDFSFLRI